MTESLWFDTRRVIVGRRPVEVKGRTVVQNTFASGLSLNLSRSCFIFLR